MLSLIGLMVLMISMIIFAADLWVNWDRVVEFFRRLKPQRPKRKHKQIQYMSIKVEINPKTKRGRIIQRFDDRVEIIEDAGKVGADMDCPIVTARCMAKMLGLKPDGENSWSIRR